MIRKLEQQEARRQEERARQKAQRQLEHKKARQTASTAEELAREAEQSAHLFALKENAAALEEANGGKDPSMRAFYKEFKKVVEASDVILEVLDARDPLGCRCPSIEQLIHKKGPNKRIILVLNKIDLVPRENVEQWLSYLRNEYPTVAFKCSTQTQRDHLGHAHVPVGSRAAAKTSECVGADALLRLLKNYCRNCEIKTSITVGIIGYPNVGKSSLINSLKRGKAVGVGATPGFTRTMQEVYLDKHIKLLDCPGIVFSSNYNDPNVVLRNCVRIEQIDDPFAAAETILQRCSRELLSKLYAVPSNYANLTELLYHLAKRRGKWKQGGVPDYVAAARILLADWNAGRIPFHTVPPQRAGSLLSSQIVATWSKEFSLDDVIATEKVEVIEPAALESDMALDSVAIAADSAVPAPGDLEMSRGLSAPADAMAVEKSDDEEEGAESSGAEEAEAMEDVSNGGYGEDAGMQQDEDDEHEVRGGSAPQRQRLEDEEDAINPRANWALQKKRKQEKKKNRKRAATATPMADISDAYDFDQDFVEGGQAGLNNNGDVEMA